MRQRKNRGLRCGDSCLDGMYRGLMLCRTGRGSLVIQELQKKGVQPLIGSSGMNNPLYILQTLDRHLTRPAELTIFGRAALALGFKNSSDVFAATHDVDAILPLTWLSVPDENLDFWEAQQKTNIELEPSGLYITHLFRELEIILTPDWLARRVPVQATLQKLSVQRPSTLDLILSKMARGDENDLLDIRFLLQNEGISADELRSAFNRARVPDLPEIRQLFKQAQPKVLEIARALQNR